ncbi:MAG: ABC transporter ATP-binding protein [Polyangiaceae bacterium]|nr:ABC transporter ATP-binding protein [Polyangiaceae bacterium]
MTPALRLESLTVKYGDFVAVDALDLEIPRGEVFALLGPNGAGKSTTLGVLTGRLVPSGGRALVLGHGLREGFAAIKPKLGYVPDRDNHYEELTGRKNLELFAALYRAGRERVGQCLALVELCDAADLPVRGYSQGMRRKLLIARALLHQPELVILDEPTANLDVHSVRLVHRVLCELSRGGTTVLFTSHDMAEVEAICTRVAVLVRGRCVAQGTPGELRQKHTEHVVDVVLEGGAEQRFDLGDPAARAELSRLVQAGAVKAMRSRAQDLEAAFLEIVGRAP